MFSAVSELVSIPDRRPSHRSERVDNCITAAAYEQVRAKDQDQLYSAIMVQVRFHWQESSAVYKSRTAGKRVGTKFEGPDLAG